jgi:hypothetical protein
MGFMEILLGLVPRARDAQQWEFMGYVFKAMVSIDSDHNKEMIIQNKIMSIAQNLSDSQLTDDLVI